jgi:hypothetical protein
VYVSTTTLLLNVLTYATCFDSRLVILLCSCAYCCVNVNIAVFTLDAGPLARCQCPEGPATDHLDADFLSWFPCVLKANAEVVPKYPRCHYILLM